MADEENETSMEDRKEASAENEDDSNEDTETDAESEKNEEEISVPAEEQKQKKKKKVVRRRKTKKERENVLTSAVRLAVESGKVEFGARTGIMAGILGNAKLFVVANNTPTETKSRIENYARTAKIPVIEFDGSSIDLGSVCGRPFPISVLSVYEEGTSNILEMAKKK